MFMASQNIGKSLAIVYIETEVKPTLQEDGSRVDKIVHHEKVISHATINSGLGNSRSSPAWNQLNMRKILHCCYDQGRCSTGKYYPRTYGWPKSRQANIDMGIKSLAIGLLLV